MSELPSLAPPEPTYRAIEATLASHEPGRRFLAEHARRSRHQETADLLDAVARLHAHAAETTLPGNPAGGLQSLHDLARTAAESLAAAGDPVGPAGQEDDVIGLLERVQDAVWSMREGGADAGLCDLLDGLAGQLARASRRSDEQIGRARAAVSRLRARLAQFAHEASTYAAIDGSGAEADPRTPPGDERPA